MAKNHSIPHWLQTLTLFTLSGVLLSGCTTLTDLIGNPSTWTPDNAPQQLLGVVNNAINFLAVVSGIALIVVMVAAYQLLISAGSQEGQTRAKDTIRYAAVGLLLVVFGYAIVRIIFTLLAPGALGTVLNQ